jgi:hypothetical protein
MNRLSLKPKLSAKMTMQDVVEELQLQREAILELISMTNVANETSIRAASRVAKLSDQLLLELPKRLEEFKVMTDLAYDAANTARGVALELEKRVPERRDTDPYESPTKAT